MGVLITLNSPTKPMHQEEVELYILTSGLGPQVSPPANLGAGAEPKIPPMRATFQRAQRLQSALTHRQAGLFGD